MCGIAGTVGIGDAGLVARMTRMMRYRGPDDEGLYENGAVRLGNRRLSIVDLSDAGHQPMVSPDGRLVITHNGEVYNFRELRRDLEGRGHRFRTGTDTEVVLQVYGRYGPAGLSLLEGMFAFAIWDERERTLFLARDRLGIKPLFYHLRPGGIAFASEIKPLCLVPELVRQINRQAVASVLRFAANLETESMVRSIFKLPAGHYLQWRDGEVQRVRYWSIPVAQPSQAGIDETCEALREALTRSVRSQLGADVPVGAALSGGLDSSGLVALMSRLGAPVKTFTAGHGEDDPDLVNARIVADHFRTDHHESMLESAALPDLLPAVTWHLEEPLGLGSSIQMYLNYQRASENLKVLLIGEGADELFAGYPYHKIFDPGIPVPPRVRADLYERGYMLADRPPRTVTGALLAATVLGRTPPNPVQEPAPRPSALETFTGAGRSLADALRFDQATLAHRLLKQADAMGMSRSLELRVPYLDENVVKLAATIPDRHLLRGLTGKYVLRRALGPLLPPAIANRVKRSYQIRFRSDLIEVMNDLWHRLLTPDAVRRRGLFDPSALASLRSCGPGRLRPPVARRYWNYRIWTVIHIELWARLFIDREPPASAPDGLDELL